ncbi:ATPase [Sulfolobus acidocaldarius SUSAZ]|nr:ATPase [Sulfolobus acidocaldarius SUSAZ]
MSDNPFRMSSPQQPTKQPRDLRKVQPQAPQAVDMKLQLRMKRVKYKIAILSGKGGVGKSFVSSNLAMAIAASGRKVGIVDVDFHGPSVPKMLGVRGQYLTADDNGINPVTGPFNIKVVSIDFLLPKDDTPVVWRGAIKHTAIRQFLGDVNWGELDYLFIDMPPGTGDEALSIAQLIPNLTGMVIVTIPSEVSTLAVKRSINFAKTVNAKIIGVVENMSHFVCPDSGKTYFIFGEGKGKKMADEMGVPLLGQVPLDPIIAKANDMGEPFFVKYPESPTSKEFMSIAQKIINNVEGN